MVVLGAVTTAGMVVGKVPGYFVVMVGDMVGCAVASEVYDTAVELDSEKADVLAE